MARAIGLGHVFWRSRVKRTDIRRGSLGQRGKRNTPKRVRTPPYLDAPSFVNVPPATLDMIVASVKYVNRPRLLMI